MSPARAFLLLGSLAGVLFVLVTPPFQVPDEPMHFYSAYQLSELRVLDLVALNRDANGWFHHGTLLPRSLAALVEGSGVATTRFSAGKVEAGKFLAGLRTPLDARDREYLPVARYPPLGYVPQAVGIGLGRLLGASPLVLFYLGRVFALATWLGLVVLAIRTTPILRWTYALVGVMPMTLFVAASNSVDGVVIGVTFLLTAQLLGWAYDPRKSQVGPRDIAALLGLALVLALSKAPYLLSLLLLLLVPPAKLGGRTRHLATLAAALGVGLAAYGAWSLATQWTTRPGPVIALARHAVDPPPLPDVSPSRQLAFVLAHPVAFARVVGTTLSTLKLVFFHSFVGVLGWFDTLLPSWVAYAYVTALLAVSLLDGCPVGVGWTARTVAFALPALLGLVSLLHLYLINSAVGMRVVMGFQGRYLIPLAPAFFLAFLHRRITWRVTPALVAGLVAFVALTTSVAAYTLVERFYAAGPPPPGPITLAPEFRRYWPGASTAPADRR